MFSFGNTEKWLTKPGRYQRSKQTDYVGRSLTLRIFCFMVTDYRHAWITQYQCILMVSCMSTHVLCWVNPQNRTLADCTDNHSCTLLTDLRASSSSWAVNYKYAINADGSNQIFVFYEFIYLLHTSGLTWWYLYTAIRYQCWQETFCFL